MIQDKGIILLKQSKGNKKSMNFALENKELYPYVVGNIPYVQQMYRMEASSYWEQKKQNTLQ